MNTKKIFPVFGTVFIIWLFLAGCAGLNSASGSDLLIEGSVPEGRLYHAESEVVGNNDFVRSLNRALRIDNLYSGDGLIFMVVRADTVNLSRDVGITFVKLECGVDVVVNVLDENGQTLARVSGNVPIRESRLKSAVESADKQLDLWEEEIMNKAASTFIKEVLY